MFSLSVERYLQGFPDYTSPPLPIALEATPQAFRSDEVIDEMRDFAAAGNCSVNNRCQIPFPVPEEGLFDKGGSIGVVIYGGGLVDPRGYSVIADMLVHEFGCPSVIPVFEDDIAFAFGTCDSGRLDFVKAEFPDVEKWILVGHSFGGVAAMADFWGRFENDESLGGLVMLAADINPEVGCGMIDFSETNVPMASVTASLDAIVNRTRFDENMVLLSNSTQILDVFGGNHRNFGAYDDSERTEILGEVDGEALIPASLQWHFVVSSIVSVAARSGVPLPVRNPDMNGDTSSPGTAPTDDSDSSASDLGGGNEESGAMPRTGAAFGALVSTASTLWIFAAAL